MYRIILRHYCSTRYEYFNEPEAVPIISNIEIWDTAIGIAILGEHDRAMKVDRSAFVKLADKGSWWESRWVMFSVEQRV